MDGYTRSSYGDAFADVYDDWYADADDTAAMVELVAGLAATSTGETGVGRVLELAVGTGRLAVPLADLGLEVVGVDASQAMLDRLTERDRHGRVGRILGDMVDDQPPGPFDVVLIAYNSLFNLEDADRQRACFRAVAERLTQRGAFVVEAFVPDDPPQRGTVVSVRSMTRDEVVLSISEHDPDGQRAHGHLVQLVDGDRLRLRPWAIRYASPSELDAMSTSAGLRLQERWQDATRSTFDADSARHVSVYGSMHGNVPQ